MNPKRVISNPKPFRKLNKERSAKILVEPNFSEGEPLLISHLYYTVNWCTKLQYKCIAREDMSTCRQYMNFCTIGL